VQAAAGCFRRPGTRRSIGPVTAESGRPGRETRLTDRHAERDALSRLVDAVHSGESRALVVRGDPGVGKTALLGYLAGLASGSGCRVARAMGVQSEMELAFAGLHQLCTPMLSRAEDLPSPQRNALRTVLGLAAGPPPDRFLVGLAVLSLLSEVAGERPLVCVIDDAQWLDRASAQALGFAARRLGADAVGLVFASRQPGPDLAGLPELDVAGLPESDARTLLEEALTGPLDARVRDLIVAETRGNPLARSVAYRSASFSERQQLHAALAEVTDPITEPDRRAWHRAQATAGPDEEVAVELERSAGRAQARGGLAAAAAFLNGRWRSPPTRHGGPNARWPLHRPTCKPERSAKPWTCSRPRRPGRSMSSRAPGWTCCAATSRSPRAGAAMRPRCC